MIHAYHVILPCYGFWLPNDPRGSWSDFVAAWELAKFGKTTRHLPQRTLAQLADFERARLDEMRTVLKHPPVVLNGKQAWAVANGFAQQVRISGYSIWACSILPQHTHLVIARHRYRVEQIANLLKGAAARSLLKEGVHPFGDMKSRKNAKLPGFWARHQWKVYLDSEEAIENAIAYVMDNPVKEGKRPQHWSWVRPFSGLPKCWNSYGE